MKLCWDLKRISKTMPSSMAALILLAVLSVTSAADQVFYCNSERDCEIHCPLTHQGACNNNNTCTCNVNQEIVCNDVSDCRIHCPVTHSGFCESDNRCQCDPMQGTFFCNNDVDCNIHCPITHEGKCQTDDPNNQTCTCNYHPTIFCQFDLQCRARCPVTHRGSCKSNGICSCDPIPPWMLPSTPSVSTSPSTEAPTTQPTTPTTTASYCINDLDCGIHCPLTFKGKCHHDSTCACDPHVHGEPIKCHNTMDCIQHCLETHVGSCNHKTHTCSCLTGSEKIIT